MVRVKNVPVFYSPYLSIPVTDDRQSGWLFPDLGYESENGLDVALPYYWNMAPNYDMTVIPRYVSNRGAGIEAEGRYLSGWQNTTLVGAILPEDKLFNGTYQKKDYEALEEAGLVQGPFVPEDRWLYAMYHQGDFGRFRSTVDYTAVSDRDYFRDLGSGLGVSRRRDVERRGEIAYLHEGLEVRLWAQRFDRLDAVTVDAYQRVPELALTYRGDLPATMEWSLDSSYARFDRDNEDLVGSLKVVGDRFHVEPRVRLPLGRSWGFLTLMGGYRYTQYKLEDVQASVDDEPVREIGLGSADAGLYFDRDSSWFGNGATHTLEPRIYYLYQQYRDQDDLPRFDASALTFRYDQLFRDNRFTGLDRIGDANQLSVGLTSRFLSDRSGQEFFRFSVGQIFYFEDRRVTLAGITSEFNQTSRSEVACELATSFGRWSLIGNVVYDPHLKDVAEGGGYLQCRRDNGHIFNVGYRTRAAGNIDQPDISMIWPLSKRYSFVGRWNYDINSGRTIEGLAGIQYDDCCWQVRLLFRHFLDTPSALVFTEADARNSVMFQVVFKGLAGVGNKIESLLEKSLRGFRAEE